MAMNMTQILRKEILRKVQDTFEMVTNKFFEKDIVTEDEITELLNKFDDNEEAHGAGLCIDFNEMLIWIDVDNLLSALEDYINDDNMAERLTYRYPVFKALHKKLSEWKGYTI